MMAASSHSNRAAGTGTSVPGSARRMRYSRSTRCADGRSLPGGFFRRTNFFVGVWIRNVGFDWPPWN